MSNIVYVDDNNFEAEVISSKVPVLVDFSADWCGPCQRQLPILEKYALENPDLIKICKIDVDESPTVTSKLGVRGVPTLMIFNEGKPLGSKVGLISLADISSFVTSKAII